MSTLRDKAMKLKKKEEDERISWIIYCSLNGVNLDKVGSFVMELPDPKSCQRYILKS